MYALNALHLINQAILPSLSAGQQQKKGMHSSLLAVGIPYDLVQQKSRILLLRKPGYTEKHG